VAQAAGLGVRIEKDKIVVEDCVKEICQYFGMNPYAAISEGTLIASCRPQKADAVVKALTPKKGLKASTRGVDRTEKRHDPGKKTVKRRS